jgi:hypothetical protein
VRRISRILVLLLLVSALGLTANTAGAKKAPRGIREGRLKFHVDDLKEADFAEPALALSSKDHIFICGPTGSGSGFIRSADWKTFERSQINDPGGGGDCHVETGPDDAIYLADLQLAAGAIRKSTDDGKTFGPAWEDPVEQDRQWLGAHPTNPNIVYYAYHELTAEAEVVARSEDGGQTFVKHSFATTDVGLATDTFPNTFSGPVVVESSEPDRVYVTYGIASATSNVDECVNNTTNCPFGESQTIVVAMSEDDGLTWTNHVAIDGDDASVLGLLFPKIALDEFGNVYVAGGGHMQGPDGKQHNGLFFASSTDHGTTWSKPIMVGTGTGATVFPAVAAGDDGVVDFAWIESSKPDTADESGVWRLHFAQTRNAHSAHPTFRRATGPIVRHGAVCVLGINCLSGGNRDLLDFMDIKLDSFGYAHMVVASTEGGLHTVYWRQDGGPSATSEPCKPTKKSAKPKGCVYVRPKPQP